MPNTIQHKRSNVPGQAPTAAQISVGELALNLADGSLYSKNPSNTVLRMGSNWTITGSDLYRNSRVAIGGVSAPVSQFDLQAGTAAHAVVTVPVSAMDLSSGQMFTKTVTSALTWSFTNVPAGRGVTAVLHLTNGGLFAQTWPASVRWPGGVAPALTSAGTDIIVFVTHNGGTNWRANIFGKAF